MAKKREPTQKTDKGLEIPVPKRKDWDAMLDKIVKPASDESPDSRDSSEE